jgi:hypothetical protein
MKLILTVFVVSVLLAGVMAMAGAQEVLELSTLNKKPSIEPIRLPQLSPTMPTTPATALGGSVKSAVVDLSTLGKKKASVPATAIQGAAAITVTPSFAIKRNETAMTNVANTVFTLPQAISANASVYTPPIAIFGGA